MAAGFCFFNNAAVAARAAQAAGAQRVLILDWDIHHGNGTQVSRGRVCVERRGTCCCSSSVGPTPCLHVCVGGVTTWQLRG